MVAGSNLESLPAPEQAGEGIMVSLLDAPTAASAPEAVAASQPASRGAELLEWGSASLPGSRYGSLQQDWSIVEFLRDGNSGPLLAVVCDGHGPLGEEAARVSGEAVIAHLRSSPLADRPLCEFSPAEAEALLKAAFSAGHDAALAIYENPPSGEYLYPTGCSWEKTYSLRQGADGEELVWVDAASSSQRVFEFGSTCTVALLDGQVLCVANVGDSLAVLARGAGGDLAGKLVCVEHNCRDAGERERVEEEAGAAVEACRATGYLRVAEGKHRGFQLGMTRALGHRMMAFYGCVPTPSVARYQLTPEDQFCIVASDGVWEVMNPSEAVRFVCQELADGSTAAEAAAALCREAVQLAEAGGRKADNTTAAVIILSLDSENLARN